MKFLSSIVKHSLQAAKKTNSTGFSANPTVAVADPVNQQRNNQSTQQTELQQPSTFSKVAAFNDKKTETIAQEAPNLSDGSNDSDNYQRETPREITTTPVKTKRELHKNEDKPVTEIPESPALTQTKEPLKSPPLIDERLPKLSKNRVLNKTLLQKHKNLQNEIEIAKTTETLETNVGHKPSTTNPDKTKFGIKTSINISSRNKHQKNSSESPTLNQTQQEGTNPPTQNIHNHINHHVYSQQRATKITLRKTIHKTEQQTPQVRIGQINVLIEDQAKTASKPKPTTKTQSSSPFGYRGL